MIYAHEKWENRVFTPYPHLILSYDPLGVGYATLISKRINLGNPQQFIV